LKWRGEWAGRADRALTRFAMSKMAGHLLIRSIVPSSTTLACHAEATTRIDGFNPTFRIFGGVEVDGAQCRVRRSFRFSVIKFDPDPSMIARTLPGSRELVDPEAPQVSFQCGTGRK
jgi:hypothetical protein